LKNWLSNSKLKKIVSFRGEGTYDNFAIRENQVEENKEVFVDGINNFTYDHNKERQML
jgi:hypothetical protein